MPPALKGSVGASVTTANNVTTPTTLTPALPAHASGDLLLCFTTCRSGTPTVATPSGWTSLANVVGTNGRLVLFGKIAASGSETAPGCVWSNLTTGTSGTPAQAQCAVFTGTQLSVGALGTVENGVASTTVSASGIGITTVADNALVLALSTRLDDAGTWTSPSGFTEIGEAASTSGADMSSSWAYQVKAVAGSVAPADFAIASGVSFASSGVLVSLRASLAVTYFGSLALPITFDSVISGSRKAFGQLDSPVIFNAVTSGQVSTPAVTYYGALSLPMLFDINLDGQRKTFGQIAASINIGISVAGFRLANTFFGALSMPITFSKDVRGIRKTFGQIAAPFIFTKDVKGIRKTFGQLLSPLIFGKDVRGQRKTFGQSAFPITFESTTAGFRVGNRLYGIVALPVIFSKDVRGQRKTFGQIASPFTFIKDVKGVRKTFGKIDFPIIFTKEAVGRNHLFSQLSMQTLFSKEVSGRRKTFGQIAVPIIFSKDVSGRKKTFGNIAFPINVNLIVAGYVSGRMQRGVISMPIVFNKEIIARRQTFGQITAPFIFGSASQGSRRAFGKLQLPMWLLIGTWSGPVGVHGKIALPIIIKFDTAGKVVHIGVILNNAESIYLGIDSAVAAYVGDERVWP